MTVNPRAVLYGPKGPIARVGGVLVATDVAAFSPWPAALDYRTPFAVRIIAADASSDFWTTPVEVVYLRLEGAAESTNVAGVTLATRTGFPVVFGQTVPPGAIIEELERNPDGARGTLLRLGADRFTGLATRSRKVPTVAHPMTGLGPPPKAVPATFTVATGPARLAEFSICRIFRWD